MQQSSGTSTALKSGPALLLAPLLALGQLSLTYSLVTPACAHQSGEHLHALAAGALLLSIGMTGLAWQAWRNAAALRRREAVADADLEGGRDLFLGRVATLMGAFSSLTIAALWIPLWLLPPCA